MIGMLWGDVIVDAVRGENRMLLWQKACHLTDLGFISNACDENQSVVLWKFCWLSLTLHSGIMQI